jgi:hypothetical protein
VPKEIALRVLEPALQIKQSVRMICREGTLERRRRAYRPGHTGFAAEAAS